LRPRLVGEGKSSGQLTYMIAEVLLLNMLFQFYIGIFISE